MKPYIYKITTLFFFIAFTNYSQTKETVLKRTFKADKNTILNLDLTNVGVTFEESPNDSIYFDFHMISFRNAKWRRKNVVNQSKFKVDVKNNLINLNMRNSSYLGFDFLYAYDNKTETTAWLSKYFNQEAESLSQNYKSKDQIIKEIELSFVNTWSNYYKKKYVEFLENEKLNIKIREVQYFVIKVPKYVKIRLKTSECNIKFNYNLTSNFVMNSFRGISKFDEILGLDNRIIISKGVLQANKIQGARLEILDAIQVKIGEVKKSDFVSETSNVQIGKIGENVKFNDFNSKIFLFNFSDSFIDFNLTGDYSILNLYKVKESNYAMNIFGLKTTLNMNNTKTTFGTSEENQFTKILEKKPKPNSSGTIELKLKNGILNIK